MDNRSYKVALGGVISSLCLLAMFMAGVAPFLYLTLPMIAGALISIIVVEVNSSWALLTYIAVSLLSVFVTYDKESALIRKWEIHNRREGLYNGIKWIIKAKISVPVGYV